MRDLKTLRDILMCSLDLVICVLDIINSVLKFSGGSRLSGACWLLMGIFFAVIFTAQSAALAKRMKGE